MLQKFTHSLIPLLLYKRRRGGSVCLDLKACVQNLEETNKSLKKNIYLKSHLLSCLFIYLPPLAIVCDKYISFDHTYYDSPGYTRFASVWSVRVAVLMSDCQTATVRILSRVSVATNHSSRPQRREWRESGARRQETQPRRRKRERKMTEIVCDLKVRGAAWLMANIKIVD